MGELLVKRIHLPYEKSDGYRILIDRIWPLGVSKEQAALHLWFKDIAPSVATRKAFDHHVTFMPMFRTAYVLELYDNPRGLEFLKFVFEKLKKSNVTLLYSAKHEEYNHAIVLRDWLIQEQQRKKMHD